MKRFDGFKLKRNGPQPIFRIRVYPEHKSLYYVVNVWRTKKDMYAHCRWAKSTFQGLCTTYEVIKGDGKGGWRLLPECGQVNLWKGRLGSAVVTHEFTHAALGWARRVGLEPDNLLGHNGSADVHPEEERFCHALCEMVRQFIDRAYAAGVYQ